MTVNKIMDPVAVTDNGGNLSVDDGGGSLTVDGSVTVTQGTAANLKVDASGVAVPVTDNGTTLSIDDGAGSITVDGTVAVTGTQTDALTDAELRASAVVVDLGVNNDVTVTGSVTANAGTNLNTSLLALEAGGNLAGAATSLAVVDDWDESDRAKVNVIVGQAGIAGGTGTDGATVPRVTLATNVPLPAGTNAIGKLAANSGVDIGDVDVTSVSGNVTVIQGTAASLNMTEASASAIKTAVELIDDIVYTDDTSTHATGTSKGALVMAAATPTDGSVNANDIGAVAMTTDRKLHVSVQDALPAGTAAIGKLAANSGVDIGDVDVTSVPTDPFGANADAASATGSISAKLRGIATALGITALDLGTGTGGTRTLRTFQDTAQFVGNSGNKDAATQRVVLATDQPALTNALLVTAAGDVAHGTGDGGNPVKVGFKAANAFPTAEANADRVNGVADLWGRQMTTHIDPAQQVNKAYNTTSTATGAVIWDPTSGKKIAITSIVIGTYGTTGARIILWFGDNADTTYSAGTDQLVLAFSSVPSATVKPGMVFTPAFPIFCTTADRELHITTDAGISIDVAVAGYEW